MVAAFGVHLVAFWVGRNEGLRGGDEGYLVYGASRTRMGEVPIRDFRAYEPGRYWFVVALSGGRVTIRRTRFACGVFHGGATAVLAASIFHFGDYTIGEAKAHMAAAGIPMRLT